MNSIMMTIPMTIILIHLMNWSNPSSLILNLIFITIITASFSIKILSSVWIGFSLFMALVGGLLILFILMASMIPNTILKSTQMTFMAIPMMILIIMNLSEKTMTQMNPNNLYEMKMSTILLIVIALNLVLMLISKMIMSPIKPYRSTS